MQINNLEPSKYKRFFAFGCSFTKYNWPTWADIIGQDIPVYENWGKCAAGNHYIFNSIIEANTRYKFNDNDLVIVMWSFLNREDRYHNYNWQVDTIQSLEKTYGSNWFKKYATDNRGFLIRDLAYISAIQNILKNTNSEQFFTAPITRIDRDKLKKSGIHETDVSESSGRAYWVKAFDKLCDGLDIDPFLENTDVLLLYKDLFRNINKSLEGRWDYEYLQTRKLPNADLHPTPLEALAFIDNVWPENKLSKQARNYALSWEDKVMTSNYHGQELLHHNNLLRL